MELTKDQRDKLFKELIEPNIKLVHHAVKKHYPAYRRATTDRYDDMIQECLIKLYRSVHLYNTYPDMSIAFFIMMVCKGECTKKFTKLNDTLGLNRMGVQDADDRAYSPDHDFDFDLLFLFEDSFCKTAYNTTEDEFFERLSDSMKKAINALPEIQKRLFMGVIFGYSLTEIADELHDEGILKNKQADNLILQYWFAIKQLRKELKNK